MGRARRPRCSNSVHMRLSAGRHPARAPGTQRLSGHEELPAQRRPLSSLASEPRHLPDLCAGCRMSWSGLILPLAAQVLPWVPLCIQAFSDSSLFSLAVIPGAPVPLQAWASLRTPGRLLTSLSRQPPQRQLQWQQRQPRPRPQPRPLWQPCRRRRTRTSTSTDR